MKKIRAIVTISGLCLLAAAGIWALGTNRGNGSTGTTVIPGDWFPWENLILKGWNFLPPKPETLPWKFQPANKPVPGQITNYSHP